MGYLGGGDRQFINAFNSNDDSKAEKETTVWLRDMLR